jgi:hypothetical protein
MSAVDRLALVSKVLLDSRFLELKRKNERLTLSLFWVDHSINTLKKLMCHEFMQTTGLAVHTAAAATVRTANDTIGTSSTTTTTNPTIKSANSDRGSRK